VPFRDLGDVASRMAEVYRVPRRSPVASLAFWSALFVALSMAAAGFGVRYEFWSYRFGFRVLRVCFFAGLVTGVLGLVGSWIAFPLWSDRRGFTLSLTALLISGFVVGLPLRWKIRAEAAPPIHDVTTDPDNPPVFRVVDHYRDERHNDLDYGGSRQRRLQEEHYPELKPLVVEGSRESCMKRALETARRLGWVVHRANWEDGWMEATDTTFWFGFKDDVVVRLRRKDDRCKVDLRSVSRVGKGDAGTNTRRIRTFLDRFGS
jgi:uncharacterized protein (DUF1499 family)